MNKIKLISVGLLLKLSEKYDGNWYWIPGYEEIYAISDCGQIAVYRGTPQRQKSKLMKLHKNKKGYLFVRLSRDGQVKQRLVHLIVGEVFLCNCDNFTRINHKNGINTDNRVNNLEWY